MNEKKLIKKKEKYIREKISKAGTHSLEVSIRKDGQAFSRSVLISDFPSPKAALDFAVKLRDETLQNMHTGYTVSHMPTVRTLYDKTFDLFPVHLKTKKKHDIFFNHAIAEYADQPINKLTAADIQESLNKYAQTHTKRQISGLLAIWRRIYKACALLNVNVIDRTQAVTVPEGIQGKHRAKSISPEDLETFLDALAVYNAGSVSGSYNSQAICYGIRIMQFTGMRPAEVFALTAADVDLIGNRITINKAVHSTNNSMVEIGKTKNDNSVGFVPVPDQLRPVLKECLEWSKNDFLLAKYNGQLWNIDEIDTLIGNVRKRCKVDFTLYMLRHQFSTDLLSAGAPLNVVRDLMRHKSGSMSLDYATSSEKDRETVINSRKFS